jgi:hypothetical protein
MINLRNKLTTTYEPSTSPIRSSDYLNTAVNGTVQFLTSESNDA